MTEHDRYEALAGACLLDEASDAERADFTVHAETCARCRGALDPAPVVAVGAARDAERWRPALGHALVAKTRAAADVRERATMRALCVALAASLAVNSVVASGAGVQLAAAYRTVRGPLTVLTAWFAAGDRRVAAGALLQRAGERHLKARALPVAAVPPRPK